MSENQEPTCFYCRSKGQEWTVSALKYALDTDRLCDTHKAVAQERIKSEPEEKEEVKTMGSFLPAIKIRNPKNWQEAREPGEDG